MCVSGVCVTLRQGGCRLWKRGWFGAQQQQQKGPQLAISQHHRRESSQSFSALLLIYPSPPTATHFKRKIDFGEFHRGEMFEVCSFGIFESIKPLHLPQPAWPSKVFLSVCGLERFSIHGMDSEFIDPQIQFHFCTINKKKTMMMMVFVNMWRWRWVQFKV